MELSGATVSESEDVNRCKRCGEALTDPARYPESEGYHSALCLSLDLIDAEAARIQSILDRMRKGRDEATRNHG